jgi:inosine-uridine nucleoside N-ribohydrolase
MMKNKYYRSVLAAAILAGLVCMGGLGSGSQAKEQVILDSDMVETLDDGTAMLMLAKSPDVELRGVTLVTGNSWEKDGAAYGLRQLEAIHMADTVPIILGENQPTRPHRVAGLAAERKKYGSGKDNWIGAVAFKEPASWQQAYERQYGLAPTHAPKAGNAVDFLIDEVRAHPGEITIVAIGPCTNVAKAIKKDPQFAPSVKRIIYMGGSFFQGGNVTPAAEFNFWFDPEAAKTALRAPFKEQIIVPLDVCEKFDFNAKTYKAMLAATQNPILHDMLYKKYDATFKANPAYSSYIWDALTAAILLDPSLITKEVTLPVDVNDQFGLSYGQSLAFYGTQPEGTQKARIILDLNEDAVWQKIYDLSKTW